MQKVYGIEKSKYSNGGGVGEYSIKRELIELKEKGHKNISLNGFTESIAYVIGLKLDDSEIKKVGNMSYITTYERGGSMDYANGGQMPTDEEIKESISKTSLEEKKAYAKTLKVGDTIMYAPCGSIVTGKQIGRASCRERV